MARLRKEYKEIQRLVEEAFSRNDRLDPSIMHTALGLLSSKDDPEAVPFRVFPLEDNFLEWHFTILGPSDSPYSGGLYHGRLQFPPDYPFSPPNLYFSTTSGRFQTGAKICLSVTGFHPEHWQPAWGPRTMLMAIREHFTVEDAAAIGYVSMDARDRRILALKSQCIGCKQCGYVAPRTIEYVERELNSPSTSAITASLSADPLIRPEIIVILLMILALLLYNYVYHHHYHSVAG